MSSSDAKTTEPTTRPPERRFEPHQGSLEREPRTCPHCGKALPAEPEVMAPDEKVYDPSRPQVRFSDDENRVEVFGGDSGFSEADPLTIHADRVATCEDVARWMADLAARPWNRREDFLRQLGDALCTAQRQGGEAA